jgi:hypothetical protein
MKRPPFGVTVISGLVTSLALWSSSRNTRNVPGRRY